MLDVVEFVADSGRWPAGTVGTVVEADDAKALIEISDDRGHGLDFISVPQKALAPARDHAEPSLREHPSRRVQGASKRSGKRFRGN
jgi:hypothetical protein